MIIEGEWRRRGDGPLKPTVRVMLKKPTGGVIDRHFLVDSGADRTIFCRATLEELGGGIMPGSEGNVEGVGGLARAAMVDTVLYLIQQDRSPVGIGGPFAAFLVEIDEEDILGRDVTNNFDVVESYRRREVLLVAPPHSAAVIEG